MSARLRILLSIALGAAAGFALGGWLESPSPPANSPEAPVANAVGPQAKETPAELAVGVSAMDAGVPRDPSTAAAQALSKTEPVEEFDGNGWIAGVALDPNGRPISGLRLRVEMRQDEVRPRSPTPYDDPSLEEVLLERATDLTRRFSQRREAVTDRDGRFRFERLNDALWNLICLSPEWAIDPRLRSSGWIPTDSWFELSMQPRSVVPFEVLLADGSTPVEAVLEVRHAGEPRFSRAWTPYAWTPNSGGVPLGAGVYEVRALNRAGKWSLSNGQHISEFASPIVRLELPHEGSEPVRLQLAPRPGIYGVVRFPLGLDEKADLQVVISPADELPDPDAWPFDARSQPVGAVPRYQFVDLDPGTYALGLRQGHGQPVELALKIEVGNRLERVDIPWDVAPREAISVRLLGTQGQLKRGDVNGSFQISHADGSSSFGSVGREIQPGLYEFATPPVVHAAMTGSSDPKVLVLEVQPDGYGPQSIPLQPGVLDYEVALVPPARLEIRVQGPEPKAGTLHLSVVAAGRQSAPRSFSDHLVQPARSGSELVFAPLGPGTYEVSLVRGDQRGRAGHAVLWTQEVELVSGANSITWTLPELFVQRVFFGPQWSGQSVRAARVDGWAQNQVVPVDDAGWARFVDLAAGPYSVSVDGLCMILDASDEEIPFQGQPIGGWRYVPGSRRDALAKAGLRVSDRVVMVAGLGPDQWSKVQQTLEWLHESTDPIAVEVERDGQRISLTVDVEAAREGERLAGQLVPIPWPVDSPPK